MELLNTSFAILLIKIAFFVLPGVVGIYFLVTSQDQKRELRNKFCNKLFGVSNAIEYPKFARFLYVSGAVLLLYSIGATYFFLLRGFF